MYNLKGSGTAFHLITSILKLKGVDFKTEDTPNVELHTRENIYYDTATIVHYLDERYPVPQLISGDPVNKARLRQMCKYVHRNPELADGMARRADPFIFGDKITLLDMIVLVHTTDTPFLKFMDQVINDAN
jgi:glutathione S-transferase